MKLQRYREPFTPSDVTDARKIFDDAVVRWTPKFGPEVKL
jgi:hypothetical protein